MIHNGFPMVRLELQGVREMVSAHLMKQAHFIDAEIERQINELCNNGGMERAISDALQCEIARRVNAAVASLVETRTQPKRALP